LALRKKKNLKFLLDAGFISDNEKKIEKLVNDSSFDLRVSRGNDNGSGHLTVIGVVRDTLKPI